MLFIELSPAAQEAIVKAVLGERTELTDELRAELISWRDDPRNFTKDEPAADSRPKCSDCKKPIDGKPWLYCGITMCHDCWKANEDCDADCS